MWSGSDPASRRYWKLRYRRLGLLVQKRLGLHARGRGQQFHKNNTKTKMAKRRPPRRGRGGGRALGRITPLGAAAF